MILSVVMHSQRMLFCVAMVAVSNAILRIAFPMLVQVLEREYHSGRCPVVAEDMADRAAP
jgi:hypothetical protein